MIYLITVNYYSTALIQTLLASISPSPVDYRLIVVNNSPGDRQLASLTQPQVQIIEAKANLGFGAGCNLALERVYHQDPDATAWLINPDTTLTPQALEQAVQFCSHHADKSIIGCVIAQPDGRIWFAGGEFNPSTGLIIARETLPDSPPTYWNTAWVTGCSMLLNLSNFTPCPQFDDSFFLYYEDFDFCRRYLAQGHSVGVTGTIKIVHYPSSITQRHRTVALRHSTCSYLLALRRHTHWQVFGYRLGRILAHALRVIPIKPHRSLAIIGGVYDYSRRVQSLGKFRWH